MIIFGSVKHLVWKCCLIEELRFFIQAWLYTSLSFLGLLLFYFIFIASLFFFFFFFFDQMAVARLHADFSVCLPPTRRSKSRVVFVLPALTESLMMRIENRVLNKVLVFKEITVFMHCKLLIFKSLLWMQIMQDERPSACAFYLPKYSRGPGVLLQTVNLKYHLWYSGQKVILNVFFLYDWLVFKWDRYWYSVAKLMS